MKEEMFNYLIWITTNDKGETLNASTGRYNGCSHGEIVRTR